MSNQIFHVTCSTDDNYVQHCMAMLCSLFENNIGFHFKLHLLFYGLSQNSKELIAKLCERYGNEIQFYAIDHSVLDRVKIKHEALSLATYYRMLLPSLLDENIDRLLYLDCDVIVLQNIISLYSLNLDHYGLAAVADITPSNDEHRQVMGLPLNDSGFCAGVLMINLKYWREYNCQEHMLSYAIGNADKLFMEDQDVLNHEFQGKWFMLPYKFGKSPMSIAVLDNHQKWEDICEFVFNPAIIHYASFVKPWLNVSFPTSDYYWKYVKISCYPNPKATIANSDIIRKIKILKFRYIISFYIHPLVPNFLDIFFKDILNVLQFILKIGKRKKYKEFLVKLWMGKYI